MHDGYAEPLHRGLLKDGGPYSSGAFCQRHACAVNGYNAWGQGTGFLLAGLAIDVIGILADRSPGSTNRPTSRPDGRSSPT